MSDTAKPKTVGDKLSAAEINDDLPIVLTAGATINGATLPVPCYIKAADSEIYACDANDTDALKFIGFAISNSTDGNDITFQTKGIVSGFTGLTVGSNYYVQDTVGTIGVTPSTSNIILVGIAISATELMIKKDLIQAYITDNTAHLTTIVGGTNAKLVTITCGFRPKKIYGYAYGLYSPGSGGGSGGAMFTCDGVGNQMCHQSAKVGTTALGEMSFESIVIFYNFNGDCIYKIINITSTGFDIQIYNYGTTDICVNSSTLKFWVEGD